MAGVRASSLLSRALSTLKPKAAMFQAPALSQWASQLRFKSFPGDLQRAAVSLEQARKSNRQFENFKGFEALEPLSDSAAYNIAVAASALRIADLEVPVGRKLGFTNTNIWPDYGVDKSNWGYMYDTTVHNVSTRETQTVDIGFCNGLEPKIEPEIVFKVSKTPSPSMDESELLSCMEWVSHGFEIVQSVYPGWKFTPAQTTAAGALHGCLFIGPRMMLAANSDLSKIVDELNTVTVKLFQNGTLADTGSGRNVLGGPLKALKYLLTLLDEGRDMHPPLGPGEIITTGTTTKALSIAAGETWSTELQGIGGLDGFSLTFQK